MQRASIFPTIILALVVGLIAGYLDLRFATPSVTMASLVIGALIIGFMSPDWWWLGALIAGLCVPGAHVFQVATGFPNTGFQTDTMASLLSVMPALLGGIAGSAIRRGPSGEEEPPRS